MDDTAHVRAGRRVPLLASDLLAKLTQQAVPVLYERLARSLELREQFPRLGGVHIAINLCCLTTRFSARAICASASCKCVLSISRSMPQG